MAGLALLAVLIGLVSGGLGGGIIAVALLVLVTGLYTVITGRPSWARLNGRKAGMITAGAAVVALLAGMAVTPPQQTASDTAALTQLETLPIKGRAPKTGYSREEFGPAWSDVDRNGCDTRNDILARDLEDVVHTDPANCRVQSGTLDDPYTGTVIAFQRGQDTSSEVQIDHVVALSDAWQKGAQQLSAAQRLAFANDPRNLQAADGPANQQKGDGDAATWLPPNRDYRCEYVARQVSVKVAYTLWVTQAEYDAMARTLADCDDPLAPADQVTPSTSPSSDPVPSPTPAPLETQAPVPAPPAAPEPYYENCDAVRAAGAAPIYEGQPGFRSKLDGNNDGVGCG